VTIVFDNLVTSPKRRNAGPLRISSRWVPSVGSIPIERTCDWVLRFCRIAEHSSSLVPTSKRQPFLSQSFYVPGCLAISVLARALSCAPLLVFRLNSTPPLCSLELELELIQTQMAQKPMLRAEVGMRVRCANKASAE